MSIQKKVTIFCLLITLILLGSHKLFGQEPMMYGFITPGFGGNLKDTFKKDKPMYGSFEFINIGYFNLFNSRFGGGVTVTQLYGKDIMNHVNSMLPITINFLPLGIMPEYGIMIYLAITGSLWAKADFYIDGEEISKKLKYFDLYYAMFFPVGEFIAIEIRGGAMMSNIDEYNMFYVKALIPLGGVFKVNF